MGIPVIEEPFTVQEMMEADEIFFTSASALCTLASPQPLSECPAAARLSAVYRSWANCTP